jgi:2'-5' RNA ligase
MERIISIWIRPEPRIKKEIFDVVRAFSKKYKVYKDLRSYKGPHVTTLDFWDSGHSFEDIVKRTRTECASRKSFRVRINGISYFTKMNKTGEWKGKRNYVMYFRVRRDKQLVDLHNRMKAVFGNSVTDYRIYMPHITISHQELDKERFYRALKEFRNFGYSRSFTVSGVFVSTYNKGTKSARIKFVGFG